MDLVKFALSRKLKEIEQLVDDALSVDGGHHKQYYLIEIAKKLGMKTDEYDGGIAP